MKFSEKDYTTIMHALRVAADRFAEDAAKCPAGHERLAEQFKRQVQDSLDLADRIEQEYDVAI
jgi:hypothetical protein